jgi:large subunit ribosomal protein L17
MKWTMMRHGNKVKHLGRPADQRKALIRSLVTETLRHGQIRTTKVCVSKCGQATCVCSS